MVFLSMAGVWVASPSQSNPVSNSPLTSNLSFSLKILQFLISLPLLLFESTGKTYRFRISNVGLTQSVNIRFEGHTMKLVEVEGSHTLQNLYSTLDVHVGQSYSVLVTADQIPRDYHIAVSSRFSSPVLATTAVLRYSNGGSPGTVGPPPGGPTIQIDYSLNQARSIRYLVFPSLTLCV